MSSFVDAFSNLLTTPLTNSFLWFFLILCFALVLRRDWVGFLMGWFVFAVMLALLGGSSPYSWFGGFVTSGLLTFVLYRYGLFAAMIAILYRQLLIQFPVTPRLTVWYATGSCFALALLVGLAFYAFRTSLAGQRVFSGNFLQEE